MADVGLPVLPTPPAPQAPQPPIHPVQLPVAPDQPVPLQPIQHMSQLNWSHFKPEFTGKLEDAEAHLLIELMIGWTCMHFQKMLKVQQFCLKLVGEARLWYDSLRPINVDWLGLQNQFRQQ